MSICRVCQEVRFTTVNLCAVPNCDSAVCAGCIRGLIQHGHLTNCLCCRTRYPPEVAQELQHAAQPPLLPPAAQPPIPFPSMSPPGVTNVRDAMGALLTTTPDRSVRRRLGSVRRRLLDDDQRDAGTLPVSERRSRERDEHREAEGFAEALDLGAAI